MAFREIENLTPLKESAQKTRMFQTLLQVLALGINGPRNASLPLNKKKRVSAKSNSKMY
jgi:hypothetical protein